MSPFSLSAAIDNSAFESLLSTAPSIRSRALALSSSLPHAHDWLNVIPSPSLGLHLQDRVFRSCLSYWLGVPLHNDRLNGFICPECHNTADPIGDHQVGCGDNGDRISRHNAIYRLPLDPPKKLPACMVSQSTSRSADVLLPNWFNGRPAA